MPKSDVDGTEIDPRLKVVELVDYPPAKLRIAGTRAINPMFLEGTARQTDKSGCFGGAEIARRQIVLMDRHVKSFVGNHQDGGWRRITSDKGSRCRITEEAGSAKLLEPQPVLVVAGRRFEDCAPVPRCPVEHMSLTEADH